MELAASGAEGGEALTGVGVKEPVTQGLRFGSDQLARQAVESKPRQEVGACHHQLEPGRVGLEVGEGQPVKASRSALME